MVCVIGACAVDAVARRERFLPGTSNPADIRLEAGGVGYRIFSALAGQKMLISAVGADPLGGWLGQQLAQQEGAVAVVLAGYRSGCYLALMQGGELLYGAADMAVIEQGMDWPQVEPHLPALGPEDFLVLEANLAPALVRRLLERCAGATRVVFESVSVEKLLRHGRILEGLHLLSGNEEEIRRLLGQNGGADETSGHDRIAQFLRQRRIDHLLVPRGSRGVRLYARWAPGEALELAPRRRVATPASTGAGDRLLAGVLSGLGCGRELPDAVAAAMREVERSLEEACP